jgi:hypothetical protein
LFLGGGQADLEALGHRALADDFRETLRPELVVDCVGAWFFNVWFRQRAAAPASAIGATCIPFDRRLSHGSVLVGPDEEIEQGSRALGRDLADLADWPFRFGVSERTDQRGRQLREKIGNLEVRSEFGFRLLLSSCYLAPFSWLTLFIPFYRLCR